MLPTPAELRRMVADADVYKMSLGKSARYQKEALDRGVLVFQSEAAFYEAVVSGSESRIRATGLKLRSENYPTGGGLPQAISTWRLSVETFRALPKYSLVLHWEADQDHLHWGLAGDDFYQEREETSEFGQPGLVFHRPLVGGWREASVGGIPLSNLHPKARSLAINMATLNRVRTAPDYFKALILDQDASEWEQDPEWRRVAATVKGGWVPKPRAELLKERRERAATPLLCEAADHFLAEIARMADTALHTAAYANGQTVLATVKAKTCSFSRDELIEEIRALLKRQKGRCALTEYEFLAEEKNPHLRPSLDRIDSALGYEPDNLQVVTRAANFFKSASDAADWALKATAMERMAIAMQKVRKARLASLIAG